MKTRIFLIALCLNLLAGSLLPTLARANDPNRTVESATTVLNEFLDLKVKGIPAGLLSEAHGVAIIPGVIKVGLVVGGQRGKGVVVMKEADGSWRAPMFVTLTGGSVGWQAGAQSTDVVLVFKTKRSVEGLMKGKFTIGADAAAAAGPVGRRAGAATDAELKAEILSYSRTRGLFAGVSLDGSVLEVDDRLNSEYYREGGAPPEAAMKLVQRIAQLAAGGDAKEGQPADVATAEQLPTPAGPTLTPAVPMNIIASEPTPAGPTLRSLRVPETEIVAGPDSIRPELAQAGKALSQLVDKDWQRYLELPDEVAGRGKHPSVRSLAAAVGRYDAIANDPRYRSLAERPEFITTRDLLRAYLDTLNAENSPKLALPPPPVGQR
jgi:SH3 domain-containing YSC84-like protein 1